MNNHSDKTLVIGVNGSGKGHFIKKQIAKLSLKFEQQTFILDLYDDYNLLIEKIAGKRIYIEANSNDIINPFDLYCHEEFEDDALCNKVDFIFSMIESITNESLTPMLKSKLDHQINILYKPYLEYLKRRNIRIDRTKSPTFKDFFDLLNESNDEDLKKIAYAIEIFCKGDIKCFNGHTNINTNFNTVSYNIFHLGYQLMPLATLICTEDIFIRTKENYEKNIYTYSVFDSIDGIFDKNSVLYYFNTFLRRSRMYGGKIILVAVSFSDLVQNEYVRHIIANISKFIIYYQSAFDINELSNFLGLNNEQIDKIKKLDIGEYFEF